MLYKQCKDKRTGEICVKEDWVRAVCLPFSWPTFARASQTVGTGNWPWKSERLLQVCHQDLRETGQSSYQHATFIEARFKCFPVGLNDEIERDKWYITYYEVTHIILLIVWRKRCLFLVFLEIHFNPRFGECFCQNLTKKTTLLKSCINKKSKK